MDCFRANSWIVLQLIFRDFPTQMSKFTFLVAVWVLSSKSKNFRGFLETS